MSKNDEKRSLNIKIVHVSSKTKNKHTRFAQISYQ